MYNIKQYSCIKHNINYIALSHSTDPYRQLCVYILFIHMGLQILNCYTFTIIKTAQ